MCFSATASFSAWVVLLRLGRLTLRSALVSPLFSHQRRDWPLVEPKAARLMEPAGWRRQALVAPCASGAAAKLAVEARA